MWLRRLKYAIICYLQAWEQGKPSPIQSKFKGLKTREANGMTPSLRPKAWERWRSPLVWVPEPKGWEPGVLMSKEKMDVPAQGERESSSVLYFFFLLLWLSQMANASPHWWELISFTQSPDSNACLFRKHPEVTPRNNVIPAHWASLSPVKLTHKINHHSSVKDSSNFYVVRKNPWSHGHCLLSHLLPNGLSKSLSAEQPRT